MLTARVYQQQQLNENEVISLDEKAVHHLLHVLRVKEHTPLIILNGEGGEFSAIVEKIGKKKVIVRLQKFNPVSRESVLKIHLIQGISRGEKMDFTIQKAVELGVQEITPIVTTTCQVQLSHERWEKRLQHWRSIIISACEQCGRNFIPILNPAKNFNDRIFENLIGLKLILHQDGSLMTSAIQECPRQIFLLAGPESGFTQEEVELARQRQFQFLRLGPRILRTETAALAAISALQSRFGDF